MPVEFLAADTETTGLDSSSAQIIEICLILLDSQLEPVDELHLFASPDEHIVVEPGAAKVNGYTPEKWASHNAITQDELARRVYEFTSAYASLKLIAHNVPFDQSFLKASYERHRVTLDLVGAPAKPYSKTFGYHHIDTIPICLFMDYAVQGSFRRSYSLANITKDFNIPHDNAHTAKADIKACLDLLRYQKDVLQGLVPPVVKSATSYYSKIITKMNGPGSDSADAAAKHSWLFTQGKYRGCAVPKIMAEDPTYIRHVLSFQDLSPDQRAYLEQLYQSAVK